MQDVGARFDSARSTHRLAALLAVIALIVAACGGGAATNPPASDGASPPAASEPAATEATGEPVELRWYCCLGTGEDPTQVPTEEQVAAAVTDAFPNITLKFEVVTYDAARDTLATQIASGNGPDIVGPVGVGGAEAFHGQWLDLGPLIAEAGYDLSQFDPGAVDFYKIGDVQEGIPFAIYPSMLWYKASLFEEAGLNEPPHEYGAPYVMPDGTEVEWNYDTVRDIALILTVDANGRDATQDGFDPEQIVQYGFDPQRDDLRGMGAYFGAGALSPDGSTTVTIPDAWKDAWKWWYDGMWADHFTPTQPVAESEDFSGGGYTFFSGRIAMSNNFLWTTYGVADAGDDWNLAAIPSHNGETTSPLNADTFRILKDTKHPTEAFQALTYLIGEGSETLLQLYGGMPARTADQDAFFEALGQTEGFPAEVDWQVAKDSVQFADNPNFEAFMPKYNESLEILGQYRTKWGSTPGLDMDAEIVALQEELQATWDQ
jgi:multiple sugar transport system substrate-binding protein